MMRLIAVALSSIVLMTETASAGTDDALKQLFDSWGTYTTNRPGAYDAQQRGFLSGGSLNVRVYRRPLPPLVSVSPPRFSAGCSGIDVYLGAFSYASAQRYIQLLQQLGLSVVAGYAFQIAMKELCEPCADVLNRLENAIRQLNTLANIQPCQASITQMANQVERTVEAVSDTWESVQTAAGSLKDKFDGRDQRSGKTLADAVSELAASDDTRVSANLIWDTLKKAGVDNDAAALVMSTIGTVVVSAGGLFEVYSPTVEFDLLIDAQNGQTVTLLTCPVGNPTAGQCLAPEETDMTNVTGFGDRVRQAMFGIATNLRLHGTLSDEHKSLIKLSPVPILRKLEERGASADQMDAYVRQNSEIIAIKMAMAWVQYAADEAIRKSFDISKVYPKIKLSTEDLREFRQMVRDRLREAEQRAATRMTHLRMIHDEVENGPQTAQGGGLHQLKQLNRRANSNPAIQAGR